MTHDPGTADSVTADNAVDRCPWCLGHAAYIGYHDREWGVPCHDDASLLEQLCLEGAQAGLSWLTILNKRDHYRRVFLDFDPEAVAALDDAQLEALLQDPGIVRHRQKIEAFRSNARAVLALWEADETLDRFVWGFVDGSVQNRRPHALEDVPSSSEQSTAMSKALKRRGFKFVGPTTCYAFMQAAGLVNDHLVGCFRHNEVVALS